MGLINSRDTLWNCLLNHYMNGVINHVIFCKKLQIFLKLILEPTTMFFANIEHFLIVLAKFSSQYLIICIDVNIVHSLDYWISTFVILREWIIVTSYCSFKIEIRTLRSIFCGNARQNELVFKFVLVSIFALILKHNQIYWLHLFLFNSIQAIHSH